MPNFDPAEHKAWAEDFLRQMNHGGEWQLPSNNQVYKIDKVNKKLIMIRGSEDITFRMNKAVFGLLGYSVESAPQQTGRGKSSVSGQLIQSILADDPEKNTL